ncbi:MAG: hypothetical protein K0V04_22510 [Deltaproteobacteria bacterium]|nr:hypothetical protein [Deltaproteobacteria bacterium]
METWIVELRGENRFDREARQTKAAAEPQRRRILVFGTPLAGQVIALHAAWSSWGGRELERLALRPDTPLPTGC